MCGDWMKKRIKNWENHRCFDLGTAISQKRELALGILPAEMEFRQHDLNFFCDELF